MCLRFRGEYHTLLAFTHQLQVSCSCSPPAPCPARHTSIIFSPSHRSLLPQLYVSTNSRRPLTPPSTTVTSSNLTTYSLFPDHSLSPTRPSLFRCSPPNFHIISAPGKHLFLFPFFFRSSSDPLCPTPCPLLLPSCPSPLCRRFRLVVVSSADAF